MRIIIISVISLVVLLIIFFTVRMFFPRRLQTFSADEYVSVLLLSFQNEVSSEYVARIANLVNSSEIIRYHGDTVVAQSPDEIISFIREDGSAIELWIHGYIVNLGGHGGLRFKIVNSENFWEELNWIYQCR